ncbi:transposase [Candidatus Fukatsuia symbiotica]|uniref:transposase n=2 Tax=Candidatus Fukatsuia symbiotica TaxID=1878942 RepID=UPI0030B825BB
MPKIPQGAVIVMDNVSFHKRQDIQSTIQKSGFILEYLPTYSPDLNPTEHKWAQAKALRRKRQCDIDTLFSDPLF